MNYCGRYSNKINLSDFDEISIQYENQNTQLIDFLQEHKEQKIILIIKDIDLFIKTEEWNKLNLIYETYPEANLTICFRDVHKFELLNPILENCFQYLKLPYFIGALATDFDQLHYLCNKGVSEVYIGENICFNMQKVKKIADKYGVKLRAFPNIAQCGIRETPAHKKFFIRPEDIKEYGQYIDTFEFWGPLDRQEILLKIYKKGYWFGDLKELILDFNLSLDSRRVLPNFATMRKDCGKKCMHGDRCKICDSIVNISKKLEEQELIIKIKNNN